METDSKETSSNSWCGYLGKNFQESHPEFFKQDINQYTYVIFDGELYKIGKSKKPESRCKQLKTANPKCELIGSTKK